MFEHDLFGIPLHTFPDHALGGGGSVLLSYVEMESRAGFEPAFSAPLRSRDLEDRAGYRDMMQAGWRCRPGSNRLIVSFADCGVPISPLHHWLPLAVSKRG